MASNQIVKSLSLCYEKSCFFLKMVQPINLIICNIIEMIEQNISDHTNFSLRS